MRSGQTRRRILVSGGVLAGALVAACGGATESGAPAGQTSSGPVTIQYLGRGSAGEEEIYRDLIKQFGERNPKITVDINWAGTGLGPHRREAHRHAGRRHPP